MLKEVRLSAILDVGPANGTLTLNANGTSLIRLTRTATAAIPSPITLMMVRKLKRL